MNLKQYKSVTAFAPASVANVGCGFDIMGFAIEGIGDRVTVSLQEEGMNSEVTLSGPFGKIIPSARKKNTAGVAVDAFLNATGNHNIHLGISLEKNMPLGSGMGSSASSSAAAVFAANYLLGNKLTTKELIPFAMEGERIACGSAHADNVAPALLGGFVLIRSYSPLDIVQVKCPADLFAVVVHPHIELHTSDARRILKKEITVTEAIKQSANTAGFMVALLSEDFDLLKRSMHDLIAEPRRTQLIPGFEEIRSSAYKSGAIGSGISGSGPSVFALCRGEKTTREVATIIGHIFSRNGLNNESFVSKLNSPGAYIISAEK